ncbi:hypothetical protein LWC34_38825 [Kibdelosporangium philippinense]|uniref:Tip attachment protein J domain-containing protein n=1 Tax=Kibdelosporangium philippinense TaxID=211113 RepID=A0ABS8ZMG8_9PSEU|nr:hypothetical protein [Kibdelosporangium philippinense]MCE7008724.1 hypothetical protein [Kibdelosporangium philippinense]
MALRFPRELVVEAYLNGWTDITDQVRQSDPVSITRGRSNEQSKVAPSRLSMRLDNTTGDWNPRNPLGAYYGLLGRNTPFRVSLRVANDEFTRIQSNGWGTSSSGDPWSIQGTASQFAVNGSAATQRVASTATFVNAWLTNFTAYNVYVRINYTPTVTDVTGGPIEPATIMLRYINHLNYYQMRVIATTDEQYQLRVLRLFGGSEHILSSSTITVPSLTHTNGQTVCIAAMIEGRTLFGKVWPATDPEPFTWHAIVSDQDDLNALMEPGSVGIRSGVAGGNTNAKPITFTYDNLDVRVMRMAGELSEITQDWDESHTNKRASVKVEGPLRRLGQGDSPLKSTLRRAYETEVDNPPIAYWPCEDGPGATQLSSAVGGPPMAIIAGNVDLASFTKFLCSAPLPLVQQSRWYGPVPNYTPTGKIQVRFLMSIPASGTTDGAILCQMYDTGTAPRWEVSYDTDFGGCLVLKAYDKADAEILNTGIQLVGRNGKLTLVSLELVQDGSDVDYNLLIFDVGAPAGFFHAATLANRTIGRAVNVNIAVGSVMTDVAFGHITVQGQITSLFDQLQELNAWAGELAGRRFERLCRENNIPSGIFGNVSTTAPMGPQQVDTLLDLLFQCAEAEQGILCEFLSTFGLLFRTRQSLYAQESRFTLDYAAKQVAPPLLPLEDDQATINDVTARQPGGSEFRAVQLSGPLNVNSPWEDPDGVGRYEVSVVANVHRPHQLADVATWVRHLGTIIDARFRSMTVNLRAPTVSGVAARVLAADIGDRGVITNVAQIDRYQPIDQMIQGYTETFNTAHLHVIKFNATPYAGYRIFVLDEDRLEHDDSSLAEDLTITETIVDVANHSVTRWINSTDHAAHFPFNAQFGGEEVTVTAISGTGAVQTFTVVRSVNGVIKTHTAGTAVTLAKSVYLGR